MHVNIHPIICSFVHSKHQLINVCIPIDYKSETYDFIMFTQFSIFFCPVWLTDSCFFLNSLSFFFKFFNELSGIQREVYFKWKIESPLKTVIIWNFTNKQWKNVQIHRTIPNELNFVVRSLVNCYHLYIIYHFGFPISRRKRSLEKNAPPEICIFFVYFSNFPAAIIEIYRAK